MSILRRSASSSICFFTLAALSAACSSTQAPAGATSFPDESDAAAPLGEPDAAAPADDAAAASSCTDREELLVRSRAVFDERRKEVQAKLGGEITAESWSTTAAAGTWGPRPKTYPSLAASVGCADAASKRELALASANYWVEQGVNYCHHHVPGWTPPNEGAFRNSTGGSTSGGGNDAMTCTANRFADGHQRISGPGAKHVCSAKDASYCDSADELDSPDPAKQVNWQGFDCSDFTSWYYNFAGLTAAPLPTAIGTQACTLTEAPGALFDINAENLQTAQADGKTLEDKLLPGDLLYVLAAATPNVSHVVTWTGLRWNDLASSAAASAFDPSKLGDPSSRLGGDLASYELTLAELAMANPFMIVDSHYAGPAYRPFNGWYRERVTHVRRIIDADAATRDPVLAPYRLEVEAGAPKVKQMHRGKLVEYDVLVSAKYASRPAGDGHRLLAAAAGVNSCARDGELVKP